MLRLLVLVLAAAPVAARAESMALPAQYAANQKGGEGRALSVVGDFLVAAQGNFRAPGRAGEIKATWPFEKAQQVAAPNASGIVALSLVALHAKTGDQRALAAARAWGDARLAGASTEEMFDPDVEALAALASVLAQDGAKYRTAARAIFEARHGGANGREIVERLFLVRRSAPSLVGYDAANVLRAAMAVGDHAKAREISEALEATAARWNVAQEHGYHLTSRAAVLEALVVARIAIPLATTLREQVLSSQGADGSWGTRNTQPTAYSVRALFAAGDTAAAQKGLGFLRTTQLKSGGWGTFNDFLPEPFVGETVYEVSAEVLLSLLRAGQG